MLSKFKIWFYLALAGLFAILTILVQSFRYKAEKYRTEARLEKNSRIAIDAVRQVEKNMKARQRAARKKTEDAKRTTVSRRPDPDSDFGSSRLPDDN